MSTRVAVLGFGNVGRALARMLVRVDAPFTVTAIGTKNHGAVVEAEGIPLAEVLGGTRGNPPPGGPGGNESPAQDPPADQRAAGRHPHRADDARRAERRAGAH